MSTYRTLDPLRLPLAGTQLIEASAGTGKTWTIAALYLRLVLGHDTDPPRLPTQILVMSFTRAATAELRERIRARLTEAAYALRHQGTGDAFLSSLVSAYPEAKQRASAARKLELAAQWMDESAVFTIHGWCQRMLTQHAFTSGEAAISDTLSDDTSLLNEAVRDYWRNYVFPLSRASVTLYRALWANPEALRTELYQILAHLDHLQLNHQKLENPPEPAALLHTPAAEQYQLSERARMLWSEQRDIINQLLNQAITNATLSKISYKPENLKIDHHTFDLWVATGKEPGEKSLERHNSNKLGKATIKGRATPTHPFFDAIAQWHASRERYLAQSPREKLLAHAGNWVAQHMATARQQQAVLSFDDTLIRLNAALYAETGETLAERIAEQFPVALVDEFQDTDPLQWSILRRIYLNRQGKTLLLIGDPKQAIYSFRGADIYTYLAARETIAETPWTLDVNHRSSASLVEAVNQVFSCAQRQTEGAFGFGDRLPFVAVRAKTHTEQLQLDGVALPALHIAIQGATETGGKESYQSALAGHAAAQVVSWLHSAQCARCHFVSEGLAPRVLALSDIAILVRDRHEAAIMRKALRLRNLAHAYLSEQQSVYQSDEALAVQDWLYACAEPGNDRAMRRALATLAMAYPLSELDRLRSDETYQDQQHKHFYQLHTLWQNHGVLTMLHALLHRFDIPLRLLARADGERILSNLLQLAELLQQVASTLDGDYALIHYLGTQIEKSGSTLAPEEHILRMESDTDLIKLMTIHASKGLEYPIVMAPFVCMGKPLNKNKPLLWHDNEGNAHLELCPDDAVMQQTATERLQEDLRLFYVTLTRARHLCWLGGVYLKERQPSAFTYALSGRQPMTPDTLIGQLEALVAAKPNITINHLPALAEHMSYRPAHPVQQGRAARCCTLPPPVPWRIDSYSALCPSDAETPPTLPHPTKTQSTTSDIHDFERGAVAGNFLHTLLEYCADAGFAWAAAAPAQLRDIISRRCQAQGWNRWTGMLTQWLPALLRSPLPLPDGTTMSLAELSDPTCYRSELEFWFEGRQVSATVLDQMISKHTLDGAWRPPLAVQQINGMLHGFIDLVFEYTGRWYLVDYKSNYLGQSTSDYNTQALSQSIRHRRYDLQYALYTLALHRQLKARLPNYDYDRHMGGVLYLYLRGIVDGGDHGVYRVRLLRHLVESMDELFTHGSTHHAA